MSEKILVLNFGGRYNQSIARTIRENNVYSEVHPYNLSREKILAFSPRGIIMCNGEGYDKLPDYQNTVNDILTLGLPTMGTDFSDYSTAAGKEKIKSFLFSGCRLSGDWTMERYAAESIEALKGTIGDQKVLLALSGGVDSSACAALLSRAAGENLTCIFVDHGFMRKNEPEEVEQAFAGSQMRFIRVDARQRFLDKVAGVSDPEEKRKIIGAEFITVFEEEAKKIGAVDFFAQGPIYPDILESGLDGYQLVKSHHNVGGMPEHVDFKEIIEPLRLLFKDEVRKLGRALGLPETIASRQPFPGPGLAVRVIGEITKEKLDMLRDADLIFRKTLEESNTVHPEQYFAILTPMRSTGVRDGARTFEYTLALRAIATTDFTVADWVRVPYDVLDKASRQILSEVKGINRIVYDITSKPPGTIEWE